MVVRVLGLVKPFATVCRMLCHTQHVLRRCSAESFRYQGNYICFERRCSDNFQYTFADLGAHPQRSVCTRFVFGRVPYAPGLGVLVC